MSGNADMKVRSLLVLGGCRSGKSAFALNWARAKGAPRIFVATAAVLEDAEMKERVDRHQRERGDDWQTIEAPFDPASVLRKKLDPHGVVLVDCLTMWAANLFLDGRDPESVLVSAEDLARAVIQAPCPVALVADEVGLGVVPESNLGRAFRDAAGEVNQIMARAVEKVVFMVAGCPLEMGKPQ